MDANVTQTTEAAVTTTPAPNTITTPETPQSVDAAPKQDGEPSPKADEQKEEPKADRLSPRFAALAKKEKIIQQREAALKAREQELKAKLTPYEQARANAKLNPLKALEELGVTYEELTKFKLSGGKVTPEMEIKAIKDDIERERLERAQREEQAAQKMREQQEQALEAQVQSFKSDIATFIKADPDKFEFLQSEEGSEELVYSVINEHYQKTQRILSLEEASLAAESFLESEYEKKLSLKKIQAKVTTKPKEPAPKEQSQGPKTLTNSHQTTVPSPSDNQSLSQEERLARAASLLKWS